MPDGFEWNDRKAQTNLTKHGVSFEEAATIFADESALIQDDVEHSWEEFRLIRIGSTTSGRVLLVVYVEFDEPNQVYRIISARKATPAERRQYESQRIARS